MEGPLRLFFALPLPGDLCDTLASWQRGQRELGHETPPDGLHLTLAFLGDRPRDALSTLEAVAALVAGRHATFSLQTAGLGGFPTEAHTKILWLGLDPSPALVALAMDLRTTLSSAGEGFDPKPFHPHLTLARLGASRAACSFAPPPGTRFSAEALVLFQSRAQGSYTTLRTWNLRAV